MNRRKFVVVSTVLMFAVAGLIAGLTYYSSAVAEAAIGRLPAAVRYFPADSQAVVGINVRAFLSSPFYAAAQARRGAVVGSELNEFIEKTGVDPRTDIDYIVAGGRALAGGKGNGALIAIGRFNEEKISSFIRSKSVPMEVNYGNAVVLMIPEQSGTQLEKGIAFLDQGELALGDLESLKAILDVRAGKAGVKSNQTLVQMLDELDPDAMFWFAGDAANIMSKAPVDSPLGDKLSAIQTIFGTLDLGSVVTGQLTATALSEESATQLAAVVNGLVALGSLASTQNPEMSVLKDLVSGITIMQDGNKVHLKVSFSAELLDKLEQAKMDRRKVI